jgi:hypothetical protein
VVIQGANLQCLLLGLLRTSFGSNRCSSSSSVNSSGRRLVLSSGKEHSEVRLLHNVWLLC